MVSQQTYTEESVVGSILLDSSCLPDVLPLVSASDFSNSFYKNIFDAAVSLYTSGQTVDPVLILGEMNRRGQADRETEKRFKELMDFTPTAANVLKYAELLKEESKRRALIAATDKASNDAMWGANLQAVIDETSAELERLTGTHQAVVSGTDAVDSIREWMEKVRKDPDIATVKTGFSALDEILGGFFKTGFYVIGARPGMGKTTVSLNIADRIAAQNKRVLFVSLEMDKDQITAKRLAYLSGIGYKAIYTGRVMPDEMDVLENSMDKIIKRGLDVVETGVNSVADLSGLLQASIYDAVFVDYLGLMSPAQEDVQRSKYEQVTNLSKALKALAKNLHIPIIALSQLNRESQSRKEKRPSLTDLRDTGAIEQDADGVILLHREGYYQDEKPEIEDIEFIVAKNRHGVSGVAKLVWHGATGAIREKSNREEFE